MSICVCSMSYWSGWSHAEGFCDLGYDTCSPIDCFQWFWENCCIDFQTLIRVRRMFDGCSVWQLVQVQCVLSYVYQMTLFVQYFELDYRAWLYSWCYLKPLLPCEMNFFCAAEVKTKCSTVKCMNGNIETVCSLAGHHWSWTYIQEMTSSFNVLVASAVNSWCHMPVRILSSDGMSSLCHYLYTWYPKTKN